MYIWSYQQRGAQYQVKQWPPLLPSKRSFAALLPNKRFVNVNALCRALTYVFPLKQLRKNSSFRRFLSISLIWKHHIRKKNNFPEKKALISHKTSIDTQKFAHFLYIWEYPCQERRSHQEVGVQSDSTLRCLARNVFTDNTRVAAGGWGELAETKWWSCREQAEKRNW